MKRQDFRFFHRIRVRWSEVDVQRIVFNAHYLTYFDVAITEYWRALAMPYDDAMAQLGGELYLKKASVEFNASAHMDDQLDVGMSCTRIGNSSMSITGAIFRGEELLITGELIYVFADPATQTSKPIPAEFRALIQAYEDGDAVTSVRVGGWAELGDAARRIRTSVFVEEQKSRWNWNGTRRTRPRSMPSPSTAWASQWRLAVCWALVRASPRLAAWRCTVCCAVPVWGATS